MQISGGHGHPNDPRGVLVIPMVWMTLVAFLSFATIIVTATNSEWEDAKAITAIEAIFYIAYLVMFCNVVCIKRKANPTKWKMFFIVLLILGGCNIIFCAINLSIVTTSNMDILIMTAVQTGIVLAFSIICTLCCLFCNFCTDFNKSGAETNVNVQI